MAKIIDPELLDKFIDLFFEVVKETPEYTLCKYKESNWNKLEFVFNFNENKTEYMCTNIQWFDDVPDRVFSFRTFDEFVEEFNILLDRINWNR